MEGIQLFQCPSWQFYRIVEYGAAVRTFAFLGLSWLEWIGLLVSFAFIIYQTPRILSTIYNTCVAPPLGFYTDLTKMGEWAVVTGATDGLGKAYAQEIARLGVNIVLISRSTEKLQKVAQEIETEFDVETKVIAVDFTHGLEIYDKIEEEMEGLEVGTLINNVGMWYPYAEYFAKLPNGRKYCHDLIQCNVMSVTQMCRLVLPQMVERGKGVIINISSQTSLIYVPLMSVYAATKTYVDAFSQSIAVEYAGKGVIIQTLLPAYVATKMSGVSNPTWTSPSPTHFVQKALKTVGVQRRTAAYIPHRLAMWAYEFASFYARNLIMFCSFLASSELRLKSKKRQATVTDN